MIAKLLFAAIMVAGCMAQTANNTMSTNVTSPATPPETRVSQPSTPPATTPVTPPSTTTTPSTPSTPATPPTTHGRAPVSIESLSQELEHAYRRNSYDMMSDFIANWSSSLPPIPRQSLVGLTPEIQNVYAIFHDFYDPYNLTIYNTTARDLYNDTYVVVVQNSIKYQVEGEPVQTINNFRPRVNFTSGVQVVYLTDVYRQAIMRFLGNDTTSTSTPTSSPTQPSAEVKRRADFLSEQFKVFPGRNMWHIATQPEVDLVVFKKPVFYRADVQYHVLDHTAKAKYVVNERGMWRMNRTRSY